MVQYCFVTVVAGYLESFMQQSFVIWVHWLILVLVVDQVGALVVNFYCLLFALEDIWFVRELFAGQSGVGPLTSVSIN